MPVSDDEEHFQALFEYAPISLWEEDFSGIQRLLDGLRQRGVRSLEAHLAEHPAFVDECMGQIRVLQVNQKTLELFKAASSAELLASLDRVFRDGMRQHLRSELLALWNGDLFWSGEGVNYTLTGEALDILLHWRILPGFEQSWRRVLVTLEDITARRQAERRLQAQFEASPISLWEEDYSALKVYFDALRAGGVTDLGAYLRLHPEAVSHCMGLIKVLNVNQKTLKLFGAGSKEALLEHLDQVFRDEMGTHFARELVDLWDGNLAYEREGINYSLNGEAINIHLDFRIMPGHEQDFGWAQVAIQDISARKKAEDYLRYLGTHDVMTGLYNRAFFEETLLRLEKERREPVSILLADLNELKTTNDTLGHQAGDGLIRRAAEVLKANVDGDQIAARIGGDEFIVILPGVDAQGAAESLTRLQGLVELNNKYYRGPELSISLGVATSQPGLSLEKVFSLADRAMYASKAAHHQRRSTDQ
jgi:diguanylate cyclase (GGDEF)-like protein